MTDAKAFKLGRAAFLALASIHFSGMAAGHLWFEFLSALCAVWCARSVQQAVRNQ